MEKLNIYIMDIINLIFLIILLAFSVVIFLSQRKKVDNMDNEKLLILTEKISQLKDDNERLREVMDAKLSETHKTTQMQFGASQKLVSEVTEKLTKLDETNRQVIGFSEQLKNLQDILKNPKQRGVLGEYYLEETLKNVLPPNSYQMQYKFKNGDIVDAIVIVKDKIIPVDSKFSLENYEKILNTNDPDIREALEKKL
jgi:DNA recombination protein RmuC